MLAQDIMTRDVACIAPDSSLQEAAKKMQARDVGPLPVCENDRLVGMVTDRDIVVRGVAAGRDAKTTKVREIMTPEVAFCFDDTEVEDAARLMDQKKIRRLLVLGHDKRLVGILSLGDLAVGTRSADLSGKTLERISEPEAARGAAVEATPY